MVEPRDLGLFLEDGAPATSGAARPTDEPSFDPTCCTGSDATPVEPKLARPAPPPATNAIPPAQPPATNAIPPAPPPATNATPPAQRADG